MAVWREVMGDDWLIEETGLKLTKYKNREVKLVRVERWKVAVLDCGHTRPWADAERPDGAAKRLRCWECEKQLTNGKPTG